jgi:uncharacterized membrane protein YdjX (TVP38/TMEM64 family)
MNTRSPPGRMIICVFPSFVFDWPYKKYCHIIVSFGLTFSVNSGTIKCELQRKGGDVTLRFLKKSLPWMLAAVFIGLSWYLANAVTPQQIRDTLVGLGSMAVFGYIALFAVLPALFFPVAVLALAGGLLFGLVRGSVYTFLGAIINCALMFLMARYIGREKVRALIQRKLPVQWQKRLEGLGGREGALLLIILRLIPAVPYNLINYAFGLTQMPLSAYLLFSAIGIIPGTLAFINIGDKALDPASPDFWIAIGLLLALLVITALLGKKLYPKEKEHD